MLRTIRKQRGRRPTAMNRVVREGLPKEVSMSWNRRQSCNKPGKQLLQKEQQVHRLGN